MRYMLRRSVYLVVVLFCVTFLTFLLTNLLPGGPEVALLPPGATAKDRTALRHDLHLDQPLLTRYVNWLDDAVHGDLGRSYRSDRTEVSKTISEKLPLSLELMLYAQVLALAIAIPIGVLAAQRENGWFDKLSTSVAFGFISIPNFVMALILALIFASTLHWLPFLYNPHESRFVSLLLPAMSLGAAEAAVYMRLLRTDMVATLQEDYITMAKAKGIPKRRILWRHAFRPSTFTLLTVAGLNVGRLIGGAFAIEVLFAIPGLGQTTIQAFLGRNYLLVQGTVLVIAAAYVGVNFLVDGLYSILDPRIRHGRATA